MFLSCLWFCFWKLIKTSQQAHLRILTLNGFWSTAKEHLLYTWHAPIQIWQIHLETCKQLILHINTLPAAFIPIRNREQELEDSMAPEWPAVKGVRVPSLLNLQDTIFLWGANSLVLIPLYVNGHLHPEKGDCP